MGAGVGPFADFGFGNADDGEFTGKVAHAFLREKCWSEWSSGSGKKRTITRELPDSNRLYFITPSSRFCKPARACRKVFDEAALVEFGDQTGVHEGLRFVVPNFRALRRDIFVGRLQSLSDWIRH